MRFVPLLCCAFVVLIAFQLHASDNPPCGASLSIAFSGPGNTTLTATATITSDCPTRSGVTFLLDGGIFPNQPPIYVCDGTAAMNCVLSLSTDVSCFSKGVHTVSIDPSCD